MTVLTFLAVHLSLVFFRAASVQDAGYVVGSMLGVHHGASFAAFPWLSELPNISRCLANPSECVAVIASCFAIAWLAPNTQQILGQAPGEELAGAGPRFRWRVSAMWSVIVSVLFCLSILLLDASTRFLYFQF